VAHEQMHRGRRPAASGERRRSSTNGTLRSAAAAARRAVAQVTTLTGHEGGSVIAIERRDAGWLVGVEVVETYRIPDSADILASYDVELQGNGELVSYRRTRRYARGQMDRGRG
jgi:gas vesicle protein GvpO